MKHYIDQNGNLFAYAEDGSQDDLIPDNHYLATPGQVSGVQNIQIPASQIAAAKILGLEIASLANRGARELHLRLMEKEAAAWAAPGLTVAQVLAAQPYYVKLKALDEEIKALRGQL